MQLAGDGSCNGGFDVFPEDDFSRQVREMLIQMGAMHMVGEQLCWKAPESFVSPSQHLEHNEDEGTDFWWLCAEG